MDCGPTCLQMVAYHYGREFNLEYLREISNITKAGVSFLGISNAADKIGLKTLAVKINLEKLEEEKPFPCILHWNQNHFVVLYNTNGKKCFIADPAKGLFEMDRNEFLNNWQGSSTEGVALLLEPTQNFYVIEEDAGEKKTKTGFKFLIGYLNPYQKYLVQLFLSMFIGSALSLLFPFLTQLLVDEGINHQNISFVYLVLIGQLTLFAGSTAIELIRGWIMLHVNSRINISIISDYLIKLMRLPISYFDTKLIGDIQQRIGDHNRVQSFLTGTALTTFFSLVNLVVFSIVLAVYSLKILGIFCVFSLLGIGWIFLFLKRRKQLDYVRFQRMSENQSILFELISGMQEIKLNNAETTKRWSWEKIQARIFHLNVKSLSLSQYQQIGSLFFNRLKNILITFYSAKEVIDGNITLGMMMSISYVTGQMNSPIESILGFIQSSQDAKISLDRLSEVHSKPNEDKEITNETNGFNILQEKSFIQNELLVNTQLLNGSVSGVINTNNDSIAGLEIRNLSFQYEGPNSAHALNKVSFKIPEGKVTAIVGASGSGKTTLLKLLLKYYDSYEGEILVNKKNLKEIPSGLWRQNCGTVMQEGYIFSDTIAGNITMGDFEPSHAKIKSAVEVANIKSHIEDLPLRYNTKIGNSGSGLSTGQKQRILIARAVYKNPHYLFFDEATSSLDANNESVIMKNLEDFYTGKTVLIIAHRLSTVKNAHQIIVLENGQVIETGNHERLISSKGKYFELIKNQLELG